MTKNLTLQTPPQAFAGPGLKCVTCEIEIDSKPTFHLGLAFCCAGCAANGPCVCSYDDRTTAPQRHSAATACESRRAQLETV